jgi:hypothetical protein
MEGGCELTSMFLIGNPFIDGIIVESRVSIHIVKGRSIDAPLCDDDGMILFIRVSLTSLCNLKTRDEHLKVLPNIR